jgi:hypothetical protein
MLSGFSLGFIILASPNIVSIVIGVKYLAANACWRLPYAILLGGLGDLSFLFIMTAISLLTFWCRPVIASLLFILVQVASSLWNIAWIIYVSFMLSLVSEKCKEESYVLWVTTIAMLAWYGLGLFRNCCARRFKP